MHVYQITRHYSSSPINNTFHTPLTIFHERINVSLICPPICEMKIEAEVMSTKSYLYIGCTL